MAEGFVYEAGTVEAQMTLDRDDFDAALDQVKADLDDFAARTWTAMIDADIRDAEVKLDEIQASAGELSDEDWRLTVGADIMDAETKFDFLNAEADELERPVDIPIHVSDDLAQAKILELQGTLAALRVEMAAVQDENFGFRHDLGDMGRELDAVAFDASEAEEALAALQGAGGSGGFGKGFSWSSLFHGPRIPFLPDVLGSPAGLLTILAPLVGAIQGLFVGLGAVASEWIVAGAGAAAFAAMAYGPIEKVLTAISKGTQLNGPLGLLETGFKTLESEYGSLVKMGQPAVLTALGTTVKGLAGVLPSLGPLFKEAGSGFEQFANPIIKAMSGMGFARFIDFLAEMGSGVASSFGKGFANLGGAISGWVEAFGNAFKPVEKGIDAVTKAWSKFANSLSGSSNWQKFLTNGVKDLGNLGKILKDLGNGIGQLFVSVGPSGPTALKAIDSILHSIGSILTPLIGPLASLGSGGLQAIASVFKHAEGPLKGVAQALGTFIGDLGKGLSVLSRWKLLMDVVVGLFVIWAISAALAWAVMLGPLTTLALLFVGLIAIIGEIASHWQQIKTVFLEVIGDILGEAQKLPGQILSFEESLPGDFVVIWHNVSTAVAKWFTGTFVPWLKDLPGNIVKALGDAKTILFDVGKDIVTGLWNGVKSVEGWLKSKIEGLAGDLVGWAKGFLGIHSPSTVFMAVGLNIGQGLAAGITDGLNGPVRKALSGVVTAVEQKIGVSQSATGSNATAQSLAQVVQELQLVRAEIRRQPYTQQQLARQS